jgi:hypothetical protein
MPITRFPDFELKPRHLDEQEREHPCLVFFRMFDYNHLPAIREDLWNWLVLTVTGTFNSDQYESHLREKTLLLYEHLQKVIEAAHIMHLRHKEEMLQLVYSIDQGDDSL